MAQAKKRKSQAINKRRKGALAVVLPWLKRFGLWVSLLIILIWCGAWIVLSGAGARAMEWSKQQVIQATASAGFVVEDLLVEGRVNADAAFLLALLNVQTGDPLFSVDPVAAKHLLEETEWIATARVERRLPGTVYISLQERTPTALWQKDGTLYLVDEHGDDIKTDRLDRFADLIVISGTGAPQNITALLTHINAEKELATRAAAATRISERRWDVKLDNGLVLKLPEDKDIGFAIKRAATAQAENALFDMKGLESVDLRYEDKMVLKTKPGSVQDYKKQLSPERGL